MVQTTVRRVITSVLLALGAVPSAAAQSVVGGWEHTSSGGYAFGTPSVDVAGAPGDISILLRGGPSFLYYNFEGPRGTVHVTSPGASIGVAARLRKRAVALSFGSGFELRRSTHETAARVERRHLEYGALLYGDAAVSTSSKTSVGISASYGFANGYLWTRGVIRHQVVAAKATRRLGLALLADISAQGNEHDKALKAGGGIEFHVPALATAIQVRSGAVRPFHRGVGTQTRPYIGVSFYRRF